MKFGKRKFAQVSKFTAKWKREKKERMKEGERERMVNKNGNGTEEKNFTI